MGAVEEVNKHKLTRKLGTRTTWRSPPPPALSRLAARSSSLPSHPRAVSVSEPLQGPTPRRLSAFPQSVRIDTKILREPNAERSRECGRKGRKRVRCGRVERGGAGERGEGSYCDLGRAEASSEGLLGANAWTIATATRRHPRKTAVYHARCDTNLPTHPPRLA